VNGDGQLLLGRRGRSGPRVFRRSCSVSFATEETGEGDFFYPAVNPSLFKSLEGSGLGLCEAGLNSAFRENPTAAASLNQQEFEAALTDAVTNRGDLLPSSREP
jgi:hypothetical protein